MGVLVIGMHRSGTSAVAAALEQAGLSVGPAAGLMRPDIANPEGYFEIQAVADLNDEILHYLGGAWDCPPVGPEAWPADLRMESFLRRARTIVTSSLGSTTPFALKDPRITLLLPLWRRALLDRCCAIMIVRDPAEVAWSLALRDGLPVFTGLALWAAYYRSALEGLSGLPVHVCQYTDLIETPVAVLTAITDSLARWGELSEPVDVEAAAARIRSELRRNTRPRSQSELVDLPDEVAALNKLLSERNGQHEVFEPGTLPDPSWWERSLLDDRRSSGVRLRELGQEIARLTEYIARLTEYADKTGPELAGTQQALEVSTIEKNDAVIRLEQATTSLQEATARLGVAEAALFHSHERWDRLERRLPVRIYRALRLLRT